MQKTRTEVNREDTEEREKVRLEKKSQMSGAEKLSLCTLLGGLMTLPSLLGTKPLSLVPNK